MPDCPSSLPAEHAHGHTRATPSALAAVKQWRYRPTHLNGDPVEVIAPIDVNFILSN